MNHAHCEHDSFDHRLTWPEKLLALHVAMRYALKPFIGNPLMTLITAPNAAGVDMGGFEINYPYF